MQEAETAAMRAREQRLRDELQRVTARSEQELSTRLGELAALQREKAAAAVRAGEMEGALREWQVSAVIESLCMQLPRHGDSMIVCECAHAPWSVVCVPSFD
jgi:hypothetical protein